MDGSTLMVDEDRLMTSVGISVIQGVPDYVKHHPQLNNYILPRNRFHTALGKVAGVEGRFQRLSALEKESWIKFFNGWQLREDSIVRRLSLFKGYGSQNYHSVSQVSVGFDGSDLPYVFSSTLSSRLFLDLSNEPSMQLAKKLGTRVIHIATFLVEEVLPILNRYNQEVVKITGLFCIERMEEFKRHESLFVQKLAQVPFVPNEAGQLCRPGELLDRLDVDLRDLFEGMDKFPTRDFSTITAVSALRQLGLRVRDAVTQSEVNSVAQNIHSRGERGDRSCVELSKKLIDFFKRVNHVDASAIPNHLRWIWVMKEHPTRPQTEQDLWVGNGRITGSVGEFCQNGRMGICGSTRLFTAGFDLLNFSKPKLDYVTGHLRNVLSIRPDRVNETVTEVLKWADEEGVSPATFTSSLKEEKWIATPGGTMVGPSQLVVNGKIGSKLEPHLYEVPHELRSHTTFLQECGALESLSTDGLISLLGKIAQTHDGHPLPHEELEVTVHIAELIFAAKSAVEGEKELGTKEGIFLPSQGKEMLKVGDLYYDVCDSSGLDMFETDGHQCYLGIPPLHAQYLGVKNQGRYSVLS